MKRFQASVQGMDCADCVTKITKTLQNSKGIKDVTLNLVSTRLMVEYDEDQINPREIAKKVKKLGYGLTSEYQVYSFFNLRHNPELLFTILGAVFLLTAVLVEYFTKFQYYYFFYIATLLIGGYPILRKSIATISAKRIDIDVLMVIAVTGASIIQEWTEAGVIVVLFSLAELLEKYSMDKTRKSIRALMDLTPPTAIKFHEGKHIEVPVEELVVGDKISIKPGGRIPIDGKVEQGTSYVDQSPITGESTPILKNVGCQVIAGSINMDGYLVVRVTSMPSESTVSRIIHLVEEAEQVKSKIELFIQKFAKYYTPVMVFISFLVTFIPVVIFQQPFHFWFYNSLIILIIACPCALVLSTPITVVTAITRASKKGVLIKGGKYIEELSSIRSMAIDKTGTLSTGKLKVYKVEVLDSQQEDEILTLAYSLETYAEHPIAKAIVNYSEKNGAKKIQFDDIKNLPGMGIMGRYEGKTYYIGNETLCNNKVFSQDNISCSEGESTIAYLFTDEKILAHFHLSDELRPEAKEVVKQLKHLGYRDIWMLTGDNEEVADKIAGELGIQYRAELLPEDKVTVIKELKERNHKIAMLGDGINDAPALATADVGIAMGREGTAIAVETADIVLSTDNLFALPTLIRLSRITKRTIQLNISISIITKLVFFVLAIFGIATLWMTVLIADMGASLLVIFNAMLMGKAISRQSQRGKKTYRYNEP